MQFTKRAYEFVADQLRRDIQSKVLKSGAKLATIEQLAKQFQVGRSTIREALGLLKAQGMIETVQGGGTYVSSSPLQSFEEMSSMQCTSVEEMKQLLQVRKILEAGAIASAAEHRSDQNIEELARIIEQMRNSIGDEEVSQLHDVNFHLAIARATQNQLLLNIMESLSASMARTMRESRKLWLYRELESASRLFQQHEHMYLAIVKRDAACAAAIMAEHIAKVEEAFYTR